MEFHLKKELSTPIALCDMSFHALFAYADNAGAYAQSSFVLRINSDYMCIDPYMRPFSYAYMQLFKIPLCILYRSCMLYYMTVF